MSLVIGFARQGAVEDFAVNWVTTNFRRATLRYGSLPWNNPLGKAAGLSKPYMSPVIRVSAIGARWGDSAANWANTNIGRETLENVLD